MPKTLKEIARLVNGEIIGDESLTITGVAGIQEASEGDITFLANPKYLPYLSLTRASAVITGRAVEASGKTIVRVDNPSLAFTEVVSFVLPQEKVNHPSGVHPSAVISKGARLGTGVAAGACAVIEEGAVIGEGSVIYPGCYVGRNCRIGSQTVIYPNVSIREDAVIGNRVIVHSGAVIGSDGFGFVTVEGRHRKIPQVGIVVIEDDVEIGAGVTIDRARFDRTVIGQGTKIDNLVHIAHNVIIGKNCLIVAQVGISGSSSLGNNVILAGQVGVVGHVHIGDNSVVMAKSGVSKSIPENSAVWGSPARQVDVAKKINAHISNLPRTAEMIKELKHRIAELEKKLTA